MLDLKRVPPSLVIGQQRKWRNVAGPVTCLAMLLKNSNDLIVEGHCRLSVKGWAKQERHQKNPSTPETHERGLYQEGTQRHKGTKTQRRAAPKLFMRPFFVSLYNKCVTSCFF